MLGFNLSALIPSGKPQSNDFGPDFEEEISERKDFSIMAKSKSGIAKNIGKIERHKINLWV